MLIPQAAFTWSWAMALAVSVLAILFLKVTGLGLFRIGQIGRGAGRVACALAMAGAVVAVFMRFEHRGTRVWVYKQAAGRLVGDSYILFGHAQVPVAGVKQFELDEVPGGFDRTTQYVVNDAGRPLALQIGYMPSRVERLESGLLLKTTDWFFGDARFSE